MSQIHGHERLLRNPEEVAKFNGKVVYVLNMCMPVDKNKNYLIYNKSLWFVFILAISFS